MALNDRAATAKPMKVLVAVTGGDLSGGAQQVVRSLLYGLPQEGIEPVLVTGQESSLTDESRNLALATYVLRDLVRPIRPGNDLRALGMLKAVVRETHAEVIHGHSFKAGALARLAGRGLRVPTVYTMHGWGAYYELPRPLRVAWLWLERCLSQDSTVAYVCESDRSLGIRAGLPSGHLIPVASPLRGEQRTNPREVDPAQPVELLIVARLAMQKDPLATVRTLAVLRDADPALQWHATWVGDGPLRQETMAESRRLGLDDRVSFAGSTSEISRYYQEAHVFVLLSQYEGTPLSIIEAMRARLIIVATAVGGVEEMLGQECGVLVPAAASMRDRVGVLLRVLAEPQAYSGMRERAGARALRYDPSTMVARYAMLYRSLARHLAPPAAHKIPNARWSQ